MSTKTRKTRKKLIGTVVSNKADKTITVHVVTKKRHPVYGKFIKKTTKIMAHDEKNECQIHDQVLLMMTRPLSKKKNSRLVKILKTKQKND